MRVCYDGFFLGGQMCGDEFYDISVIINFSNVEVKNLVEILCDHLPSRHLLSVCYVIGK